MIWQKEAIKSGELGKPCLDSFYFFLLSIGQDMHHTKAFGDKKRAERRFSYNASAFGDVISRVPETESQLELCALCYKCQIFSDFHFMQL